MSATANVADRRLPFGDRMDCDDGPAEPEPISKPRITAPIQVFGSGRTIAKTVGQLLDGCGWVGIPFCGGLSELGEIAAPTVICNDKHELAINLYRVIQNPHKRPFLKARLERRLFHAAELAGAQAYLKEKGVKEICDMKAAEAYFMCLWMTRAGVGLTAQELDGSLSFRWGHGSGGDSLVRWQSAIAALPWFGEQFQRCHFLKIDAFEFIAKSKDAADCALYVDPPFPKAGRKYLHNAGGDDAAERAWHARLRDALARFTHTRVVCRFYDHPLIRKLYPESEWQWHAIGGRDQGNNAKPEVLITTPTTTRIV